MAFCDVLPYLQGIQNTDLRDKIVKLHVANEQAYKYFPASGSKHHKWVGGYFDHMAQVVVLGVSLYDMMSHIYKFDFSKDDIILVAYIHDIDKIFRYEKCTDSWKIKKGILWDHKKDYPACDESAKVTQMCAQYGIILENKHLEAVSLHHGGWSNRLSSVYAYPLYPFPTLAALLHAADILSGFILGDEENLQLK